MYWERLALGDGILKHALSSPLLRWEAPSWGCDPVVPYVISIWIPYSIIIDFFGLPLVGGVSPSWYTFLKLPF
jgi:hypothetical protein